MKTTNRTQAIVIMPKGKMLQRKPVQSRHEAVTGYVQGWPQMTNPTPIRDSAELDEGA